MDNLRNIVLPEELGEGTESSIIMWYKEPGDTFEEGETLVEVQTEKVAFEVPAPFAGILKEIKVKRGETAKVGQVIATAN
ncbi:biotin/lipoyl-containing protein [Xanthomarina sp.]|jgi:pyruvate/2-oxoglutarate dehydrogenase complex dihydrolipoamide acyltransferase (E2) component|uniref:biotin/lipoyl-containing protein n=1 Tax=Xanthomarina sp. TaxID=1931211 RepID=UPI002B93861C|nr:biotin/lipoyl-containing protein [Xanthomarina sp.]HLV39514.1 biotin/lipoyl-containing protein [Xanthomarina sp.]